jgi:hypothetical protein
VTRPEIREPLTGRLHLGDARIATGTAVGDVASGRLSGDQSRDAIGRAVRELLDDRSVPLATPIAKSVAASPNTTNVRADP